MKRVREPEVMDHPAQALAYARANFADVNERFVRDLIAGFPDLADARIVDLGCGPADIPRRLLGVAPGATVVAVDASLEMLRLGAAASAGAPRRALLICARLPVLPVPDASFDAVISNSLLHHLPDPAGFWREARRLARRDAALHVMDLVRPPSIAQARAIVESAAAAEDPVLQDDFFNSLLAAFTPDEVTDQLATAGLGHLGCAVISERHWLVSGRL